MLSLALFRKNNLAGAVGLIWPTPLSYRAPLLPPSATSVSIAHFFVSNASGSVRCHHVVWYERCRTQ